MSLPHQSAVLIVVLGLMTPGCERPEAPAHAKEPQALVLQHDFGVIEHGMSAEHDFVIDTRALADDFVALGVQADCSCAHAKMLLRDRAGTEREIFGRPSPECAAQPGEELIVRLLVDTVQKEAVAQPAVQSKATLVLQHLQDPAIDKRLYLEMVFRYSIHSPVKLRPFAILDFGRVPQSATPELLTTMRGSDSAVKFGPAHCDDPRIHLELQQEAESTVLRARFVPDPEGTKAPFRTLVTIATDLPDHYVLRLAAVGQVIPDLVASPQDKLSLGYIDFAESGQEEFLQVTDHDRTRSPEFIVASFVSQDGNDDASHFAVRLEPIKGDDRSTRVFVKYLGGLQPGTFRGTLTLAKDKALGPFLPIEVVAFHHRT